MIKITGTNTYMDVEIDDKKVRIHGELVVDGFVAFKESMKEWTVPEHVKLTEEDKAMIIQKVTEDCQKSTSHMKIRFENIC